MECGKDSRIGSGNHGTAAVFLVFPHTYGGTHNKRIALKRRLADLHSQNIRPFGSLVGADQDNIRLPGGEMRNVLAEITVIARQESQTDPFRFKDLRRSKIEGI